MKKKLSIQEVANNLNISKTTVSFILNGRAKEKRISNKLTEKVLKYVEENNYKINQLAKSLSTGKSMIIALMVEKISDFFFAKIAYHIEALADQNGYKIIYCSTENDAKKAKDLIQLFRDRNVDGYIITPPDGIEDDIKSLLNDNLPVVLFDRYFPEIETDYVMVDNYNSSYDAVKYLVDNDFKNISYIGLDSAQVQMQDRRRGYRQALDEVNLLPIELQIPFERATEESTKEIMGFLKANSNLDAIFFANNYLALAGIRAIHELGLKTPDDLAIIAFDDHDVFDVFRPTISGVAQPIDEMAKKLIEILLYKMNTNDLQSGLSKMKLPGKLNLRDSTKRSLESYANPVISK